MATIVRGKNPNKKYTVRYWVDGRQREKSFATKREADDFKIKVEHDQREHIFVDPKESSVKFRDAGKRWVEFRPGTESSKRVYRNAMDHLNPIIGDWSIRHVATDRYGIEQMLTKTLPESGLGAAMVRMCYVVVRAVVNENIKAGKLSSSRINGLKLPPAPTKAEIIFPTYDQLEKMAEILPSNWGLALWLMRGCGLRIGEVLAVRWENIKNGKLRITQQLNPDGLYVPLKHRDAEDFRDIPIPDYVMGKLGSEPDRFGYVFSDVSRGRFTRWFRKAREAVELPAEFTPHTLRHIFASVSLSNGVPITDVSKWLGHRDINMTYAIYGHLVPSSWWKARHVLDDEFAVWKVT